MPLEIPSYNTIGSLETLVNQDGGEVYKHILVQTKKELTSIPAEYHPKYIEGVLRIMSDLKTTELERKILGQEIISQSSQKVDTLALQFRLKMNNEKAFEFRNNLYKDFSLLDITPPGMVFNGVNMLNDFFGVKRLSMPFNLDKIGTIDPDPQKNNKIVQAIMGIIDEVIFTLVDLGLDAWKNASEIRSLIIPLLKQVFTFDFLRQIAHEAKTGIVDLFTNGDNSQGDLIYRKGRQLTVLALMAFPLKGLAQKIGKVGLQTALKQTEKTAVKITAGVGATGILVHQL